MNALSQAAISGVVTLIIIGAGYFANRKLGIGAGQQLLVRTLKDTVEALEARVPQLEREFRSCKRKLDSALHQQDDLKEENKRLWTRLMKIENGGSGPT